jgi:CHAD domain-containing protein
MVTATGTARFRLVAEEPLADGVRRVLTAQLDEALAALRDEDDVDEAVHELRKALKRCRAVLRLVRHVIGEEAYRRENADLRDAARPWGRFRDSAVLARTAAGLGEGDAEARDVVVSRLRREAEVAREDARGAEKLRAGTAHVLEAARTRVPALTSGPEWAAATPAPGVQRALRRARRQRKKAAKESSSEALHRWRKDVKYLAYQVNLLSGRYEEGQAADLARRLKKLGRLLGDEHDLAVLAGRLEADTSVAEATRAGWLAEVGRRRERLRAKALKRGRKVLKRAEVLLT